MNLDVKEVLDAVCKYYSITRTEMFSSTRKQSVIERRQIFHYLASLYSRSSLDDIGGVSVLYGRPRPMDHATIKHSKQTISNLLDVDKRVQKDVATLVDMINYRKDERSFVSGKLSNVIEKLTNRIEELEQMVNIKKVA